jgi:hypothetical protein
MSLYHRGVEIREIDDALYAAWVAAGNPKALDWQPLPTQLAHDPQTHSIAWDGAQWVVSALPPPAVPESVPAHHLRRALRAFGMLAAVNAYMAALPDDDEMRESWEYAPYFRRDALGIESARVALGLSVAQVDGLFVSAGQVVT